MGKSRARKAHTTPPQSPAKRDREQRHKKRRQEQQAEMQRIQENRKAEERT
jgi:hypothetical protein